jgi:hypothetical protein
MGRQADFHGGTRKTLCTRMNCGGIPLAAAMKIMRHTGARRTLVDSTDDDPMGLDELLAMGVHCGNALPTHDCGLIHSGPVRQHSNGW